MMNIYNRLMKMMIINQCHEKPKVKERECTIEIGVQL